MHDIDRALLESEHAEQGIAAGDERKNGEFAEVLLHQSPELELASELLEVASEEELEAFLRDVSTSTGRATGQFARPDTGQALTAILKDAARQVVPLMGGTIDRLETARQFVRLASSAYQRAAHAPRTMPPYPAARTAATAAAQRYIPGLARWFGGTGAAHGAPRRGYSRPSSYQQRRGYRPSEQEGEAVRGAMSLEASILERTRSIFGSLVGAGETVLALAGGERDENRLTDILFCARHPEHQGRIQQGEQQLAREWKAIRDSIVRPVLRNLQTPQTLGSAAGPLGAAPATIPAGSLTPAQFSRKVPWGQRFAALLPLLDRARGNIPLDFLLGWIERESSGRLDETTKLDERGFFQIHPAESKDHHLQHERLTTDPDYSVRAGLQIVCAYADLARKRYPWIPLGSELFWRIVKLQHAMGSGLTQAMLSDMRSKGIPPTNWDAIRAYELTEAAKRLHPLLRVKPGRFALNVDAVFTRGRQIAKSLGR